MNSDEVEAATGCVGCCVWLIAIFLVVFLFSHWDQLQNRLAQILGLG